MAEEGDGIRGAGSTKGVSKRTKPLNSTEDDVLRFTQASFSDHHPSYQQVKPVQAKESSSKTSPSKEHQNPKTTKSIAEMMATSTSSDGGMSGTTRTPAAAHHDASSRPIKSSSSLAQQDPQTFAQWNQQAPQKTSSSSSSNQGKPATVQSPTTTMSSTTGGGDGLILTQKEDPDRYSGDGKYSIDDLPRKVILKALDINYAGPVITSAECGVRGRCEVFLIDGWIILLVDRKSPFVSKNARDFISLVHALRKKHGNPGYRGAVLTRESALHRESKMTPFARSTQQSLLEQGIILLSIPDAAPSSPSADTNKNDPPATSSFSSSSGPTSFSSQQNTVVVTTGPSGGMSSSGTAPSMSNQSTTAMTSESSGGPTLTASVSSHVASPSHNKPSSNNVSPQNQVVPEVPEYGGETGEGESTSSGGEEEEEDN